jgi:flagellar biosynthetic protein FliS
MLFDGAIAAINIAKFELEAGDIPKKGASISKAIDIVSNGLRASLDVEAGMNWANDWLPSMTTWFSACCSPTCITTLLRLMR